MKDPKWRKCILRGDSREYIKRIPDNSIDFILTDPPYNIGKHSTGNIDLPGRSAINNNVAEWDMIDFNPEDWADEFIRILKPSGNLFIFTSYNQLGRWYNSLDHKFDTSNFMIWHKTNPVPKIFKAGFLNSCEIIFVCWNKKHTWNFISQKEMHNFIESPICMRPERLKTPKHPAQKPLSILKKMIKIASNEDDIVFDPFMGVGSTGVAALELNRRFIGIELDEVYCEAARRRINETFAELHKKEQMKPSTKYSICEENNNNSVVSENEVAYQPSLFELEEFFQIPNICIFDKTESRYTTGLKPIIKWAGGKEKELKYILPNLPRFARFFEPFVGGGSVYMAIKAKEYFVNDLSVELASLYQNIATSNSRFFSYAEMIDASWKNATMFFDESQILIAKYLSYRNEEITKEDLKAFIHKFCKDKSRDILGIIGDELSSYSCSLLKEMEINLFRKMSRMHELELKKHILPDKDLRDNVETAIKSALYMNYRRMYNDEHIIQNHPQLHNALFLFIRNYAYSGMFRYSKKGDFNVPYGGIAYNNKLMRKKLDYYQSIPLIEHFKKSHIYNCDFEDFLRKTQPTENDFIFLDPPYDSEFSTYAKNEFTHDDQIRLANFMINECKAKWMMIIKNTDFIYSLYNKEGINIRMFNKEYLVSFMNRNDKKVTHLLITNY